jgi:hypothetical protein
MTSATMGPGRPRASLSASRTLSDVRAGESWKVAETAVAAFDSWCIALGWPFVRTPTERDFGVDGFVQVADASGSITGEVFAVQIKGGRSYRTNDGYSVAVERHGVMWRDAYAPVIVVVHDPSNDDLCWTNATEQLRTDEGSRSLSIDAHSSLRADHDSLLRSVRRTADSGGGLPSGLGSTDRNRQAAALFQCFVLSFARPEPLIAVRRGFAGLRPPLNELAVDLLSHCTAHPDIFWSKKNMLPSSVCDAVAAEFRWSVAEAWSLLQVIDPENGIDRGSIGQSVCMLLFEDPAHVSLLREVAIASSGLEPDIAGWASYLHVARSDDQAAAWRDLVAFDPLVVRTFMGHFITSTLNEHGFVSLD